jgi:hypothetical protein
MNAIPSRMCIRPPKLKAKKPAAQTIIKIRARGYKRLFMAYFFKIFHNISDKESDF